MLQAIMVSPSELAFRNVDKPAAKAGEILLQTKRIGICGSDIHVYHGMHPYTKYPIVQGHEVSGIVAEVGLGVEGFAVGDAVVFMPQEVCGECYPCRHGMYHICDQLKVIGFQANGAAQEYFPIKAEMVLKLPININLDQAAMIEPLSVAVHAVNRAGNIAGKKIVVLGSGTIGLLTALAAQAMGAGQVLISDISEFKLEIARQAGIACTVNTQTEDLGAATLKNFGPDKADVIIECVGAEETIGQAVTYARKGSTIIVVGVFGRKPMVDIGLVQDRELNLLGSLMYQKRDYENAIALVAEGKLNLNPLVTRRFPFRHYKEAYEFIENAHGNSLKVIIELESLTSE
jgi:L-iditol 2-dehydrogenase